jgi:LacI family transcriptional regulator
MRSRTTQTISFIVREINVPPLAAFVRAAHDVLHEAGDVVIAFARLAPIERENVS